MSFWARTKQPLAAVLLASVAGGAVAAMPDPAWDGANRVAVRCSLEAPVGMDRLGLEQDLCARVAALAAEGARLPVAVAPPGDPALIAPGTLALLVQAAVRPMAEATPEGRGQMLLVTMRPWRADPMAGPPALFGPAPQAAALPANGDVKALDGMLRPMLAEILPWRRER